MTGNPEAEWNCLRNVHEDMTNAGVNVGVNFRRHLPDTPIGLEDLNNLSVWDPI
jgi:hypothetical protein